MSRLSTKQRRARRRARTPRRRFVFGIGTLFVDGVKVGALREFGLGIGGRVVERDPANPSLITKFDLAEVSLLPGKFEATGTCRVQRLMLLDENGDPAVLFTDHLAPRRN